MRVFLNGRLVHLANLLNLLKAFQTSGSNLIQMRHGEFTMAGNLTFCVKLFAIVNLIPLV